MRYTDEELSDIYDKNNGYCWYCGKKLAWKNYGRPGERGAWEVDHSWSRARGGSDWFENLVPACISCNRSKGDSTSFEFHLRKYDDKVRHLFFGKERKRRRTSRRKKDFSFDNSIQDFVFGKERRTRRKTGSTFGDRVADLVFGKQRKKRKRKSDEWSLF